MITSKNRIIVMLSEARQLIIALLAHPSTRKERSLRMTIVVVPSRSII
ncbi:MAG: hypothetical protein AB1728_12370 [Bacteroidota bacterium]